MPDGSKLVFSSGQWVKAAPAGATPRPDYGAGAYQAQDGTVLVPGKTGPQVLQRAQQVDANQRGRLSLSLAPAITADRLMTQMDVNQHRNPLNQHPVASMVRGIPYVGSPLSKVIGGQDYQDYDQASGAFEAAVMPLISGAAVTPSEAERQIRATLPQLGDSVETLQRKAAVRHQMLNGAAKTMGDPLPYPDTPTYGITKGGAAPQPAGVGATSPSGQFKIVEVR